VNPNKRIECVLQAIGTNNQLRSQITYTLAGAVELDVQEKLDILAAELGVDLKILGEVSDRDLHRLINQADILCCLRKPTLEAASASAIESMLYGKAVIVEDAGFYAELPDDCVQKIDPNQEIPSLQSALLDLISNPVKRRDLAKRAQEWAKQTFSARNYALQLLELIPQSQKSALLHETLSGFARQLSLWNSSAALLNLPETLEPLKIFESNPE
jgi:glycosyltransferase involved in cell wall biosynthesis